MTTDEHPRSSQEQAHNMEKEHPYTSDDSGSELEKKDTKASQAADLADTTITTHGLSEKAADVDALPEAETSTGGPLAPADSNAEPEYPSTKKVIVIMIALYMSIFLVALDRTIIGTAIPQITDDFHSLGDVGWYGSAYMLTGSAFMLLFGRIYTFYSCKIALLSSIALFEIGSAICGAAPTSTAFIIGRAIAGLGSSGVFSGAIVLFTYVVPLHKRPIYQGMFGSIFGVASVVGPLLGGVFTTDVTWRWCFYINLPIGGVAMVILFFILQTPPPRKAGVPLKQQLLELDPIGTALFLPSVVCLLLALQWGGSTYAWKNARIIALLILAVVLGVGFIIVQIWKQDMGTVPPRIVKNRSIAAGMWSQFCLGASMMIMVYYLPIWFQAIKNVSAVKSGIDNLPLILSLVVASIISGILVSRIGYYTPFMISNSVIMSIGAGLITTFTPSTGHAKWIGYQVIYGFGLGQGMQQASMAAQTVLKRSDVPVGVSVIMFTQQLGGAIFISIGQNVFSNKLGQGLTGIGGLDAASVVSVGATELRKFVPVEALGEVLGVYNHALVSVFRGALAMSCLGIVGSLSMEWKSVKKEKMAKERAAKDAGGEEGQKDGVVGDRKEEGEGVETK